MNNNTLNITENPKLVQSKLITDILLNIFRFNLTTSEIIDISLSDYISIKNDKYFYSIRINWNTIDYEPKMTDRFFTYFPYRFDIEAHSVSKISRPKFINNEWQNIEIEFIDTIGFSVTMGLQKIIKANKNFKPFKIEVYDLDPSGMVIGGWIYRIGEVVSIDFGDNDYETHEIIKPKMILKPISCKLI
jgi:uncharacterized protein Usg